MVLEGLGRSCRCCRRFRAISCVPSCRLDQSSADRGVANLRPARHSPCSSDSLQSPTAPAFAGQHLVAATATVRPVTCVLAQQSFDPVVPLRCSSARGDTTLTLYHASGGPHTHTHTHVGETKTNKCKQQYKDLRLKCRQLGLSQSVEHVCVFCSRAAARWRFRGRCHLRDAVANTSSGQRVSGS